VVGTEEEQQKIFLLSEGMQQGNLDKFLILNLIYKLCYFGFVFLFFFKKE